MYDEELKTVYLREFVNPMQILGLLTAIDGTVIVLNEDDTAKDLIMNMDNLKILHDCFEKVYDPQTLQKRIHSPEGHEELFRKIGELFYEQYPALFGVEAYNELKKRRAEKQGQ